ncbi:MAG: hypothetical protein WCP52_01275 [Bacteroidota bacterium]
MKKQKKESVNDLHLSAKDRRLIKNEQKRIDRLKTQAQVDVYWKSLMKLPPSGERHTLILFALSVITIKAKLGMPRRDADFLKQSEDMHLAQANNTLGFFSPAFARLVQWKTENEALHNAMTDVTNGVNGAEGIKKDAKKNLQKTLKLALAYVNGLALDNQAKAEAMIEAALMKVIKQSSKSIKDFSVKQMEESGTIQLRSEAAKIDGKRVNAGYDWQYSINNGATWIALPSTVNKAKTLATDMAIGVATIFRKRVTTTKGGTTAWVVSKPITPQ